MPKRPRATSGSSARTDISLTASSKANSSRLAPSRMGSSQSGSQLAGNAARRFTRRLLLRQGAAVVAVGLLPSFAPALTRSARASSGEVNVLSWTGYLPEAFLRDFENQTGIRVNVVTMGSNEELIIQMQATHGRAWDIVSPSAHRQDEWRDLKLTRPWDLDKVPNLKNVQASFLHLSRAWEWGGGQHHLPHVWGTEAIAWRTDKFQTAYGDLSLADLWRPEVKGKVQGRPYSLLSGIGRLLAAQGKLPPFEEGYKDDDSMRKIWDDILTFAVEHKSWIRSYWQDHEQQITNFTRNGVVIGQTWDGPAIELEKNGQPVSYLAPKEGAFAWLDGLCLSKASKNGEQAHAFVNALYTAKAGGQLANATGYNSTVDGVDAFLNSETRNAFRAAYPEDALDKLWWWPNEPTWYAALRNEYRDKFLAA